MQHTVIELWHTCLCDQKLPTWRRGCCAHAVLAMHSKCRLGRHCARLRMRHCPCNITPNGKCYVHTSKATGSDTIVHNHHPTTCDCAITLPWCWWLSLAHSTWQHETCPPSTSTLKHSKAKQGRKKGAASRTWAPHPSQGGSSTGTTLRVPPSQTDVPVHASTREWVATGWCDTLQNHCSHQPGLMSCVAQQTRNPNLKPVCPADETHCLSVACLWHALNGHQLPTSKRTKMGMGHPLCRFLPARCKHPRLC